MFSVWPCPLLSEWAQMNLWRCNSTPGGVKNGVRETKHQTGESSHTKPCTVLKTMPGLMPTWKCSCPGKVLWGNSGRNMAMNPGRLHSALSLSGPTPASLRTCSGISGALPWSIRRWPRRRAGGARRQMLAGMDRPMLDRKPRHPDEKSSSSCLSAGLCSEEGCIEEQLW